MSTQPPEPGRLRRLAAGVSRWRNTRRGTATIKAAYAQAAREARAMDPAVRAAIGRSGLTKDDLKHLAQANTAAAYGPNEAQYAQQYNAWATSEVQATTPAEQRTRNPIKQLSNRVSRWQDTRQGTATLKAAYAQAARDAKRMDPAVREAIGRSRINSNDLKLLSQAQVIAPLQAGVQLATQQHQAAAQAAAQARAAAQAAQGPRPPSQTAGQRVANVVNTVSRWAEAAKTFPREKAQQFMADYNERRQNPTGRSARPQTTAQTPQAQAAQTTQPLQATQPLPTTQPLQATQPLPTPAQTQPLPVTQPMPVTQQLPVTQPLPTQGAAAAQATQSPEDRAQMAKAMHVALNNTMPHPAAGPAGAEKTQADLQKTGGGRHRAPDAAAVAFSGVAGASGATRPAPAQTTNGERPDRVGAGQHHKPEGHEK